MKKGVTIFARGVVYLAGLSAIAVCAILLPELAREEAVGKSINPYTTYAFLGGAYVLAIPFFVALYQTLKLLNLIDANKIFSKRSLEVLQSIKNCAIVFSIMIVVAVISSMIVARIMNPREDITFMVPLGFVFTFVPVVIAVFVTVLQKIIADAVRLKIENDLIV